MTDRTNLAHRLDLHVDPWCGCGSCADKVQAYIRILEGCINKIAHAVADDFVIKEKRLQRVREQVLIAREVGKF